MQSIPAGNSWKFVKLLNGKEALTIPVINHDEKRIACDEQKADALNHLPGVCMPNLGSINI